MRGLRASALAGLAMLVVEYGFGMWVNLYARLPPSDHGPALAGGAARAVVDGGLASVVVNGPAGLSAHVVLGLLIFLTAISVVVRAVLVRRALPIVLAAAGLASVLVSAGGGTRFLAHGSDNASLVMALGAGLAIACYAVILFASPGAGRSLPGARDAGAEDARVAPSERGAARTAGRHG